MLSALPEVPEKPAKPVEIKNADILKEKLKNERNILQRYETAKKSEKSAEAHEKKLEIYNEIIKILSPKTGVREKIIEIALKPLVEHCNETAKRLRSDFKVGMVIDNGVKITCSPNVTITEMLPLESVSSGEQVYALLLIMDALNALSGLGILILDDLDKLDENALDSLFNLLSKTEVADPYDHIFMAMVNHEDSQKIIKKYKPIINNLICL